MLHVLMLRRVNNHLVGLYCFVDGRINVRVDILGLLELESIVTAISEGAQLHHVHGRHDACVDCIGRVNVHWHVLGGIGVHLKLDVIGSTVLVGISVVRME